MASPLSRLSWVFLTRNNANLPRNAMIELAGRCARLRTFYSQQQKVPEKRTRKFLTCTALASSLGFALYHWKNNIWQRISNLGVTNCPVIHAVSLSQSDGNQNRDKYNFIADVVEISAPSVVYIEIKDNKRRDLFTGKPVTTSNGSGFIVSQDGLILTNAHVVIRRPNTTLEVRLHNGSIYTGVIEDVDLQSDLATVRINKTNLPVIKLGNSSNLRPGEFVVAIGSPLALSNTITSGIVSTVNRQSGELGLYNKQMGYIQTDAAITFGNSGGPLVNLNGEAIGINAMKVTSGISFAIPIDYAKDFLKKAEARRKGEGQLMSDVPKRRFMGITMQSLLPEFLVELQQDSEYMFIQHGVVVWKVIPGSPAFNAGLQSGDIVTHANDKPVACSDNIYKILEKPGMIRLKVLRRGQILQINIDPEDV